MVGNGKKNNVCLYVDLIRKATQEQCFANWNPARKLRVGDVGVVDERTGQFERHGSIYDPKFMPELKIRALHSPEKCSPETDQHIASRGHKEIGFDAEILAQYPEFAKSRLKGRWLFSSGRGATLMLHKPNLWEIRDKAILFPKIQHHHLLEGKALITSIYTCKMYSMFVIDNSGTKADVAVGLSITNVGHGNFSGKWHRVGSADVWKCGGEENATYYPLCTLQTPQTQRFMDRLKKRRAEKLPEGAETFRPYRPPWDDVDDNARLNEGQDDEDDQDILDGQGDKGGQDSLSPGGQDGEGGQHSTAEEQDVHEEAESAYVDDDPYDVDVLYQDNTGVSAGEGEKSTTV